MKGVTAVEQILKGKETDRNRGTCADRDRFPAGGSSCVRVHGLEIDRDRHEVKVDGEEVRLTPTEFNILYLLADNPGRVFSTDEIFEQVWHERAFEVANTVMVHIRRMRGKLKDDNRRDKIITTVWGVGYKIDR